MKQKNNYLKILSKAESIFKKYLTIQDLYDLDFLMGHLKEIQK